MSNITDEQILSLPITHLVDLQIKKQLTAVRILKVYLKRAKEINEATNCYTCFVPEAIQEAQRKFELAEKLKADALLEAQLKKAQQEIAAKGYQDYGQGGADQATQDSYQGSDGNYAGASTQDYDTPD